MNMVVRQGEILVASEGEAMPQTGENRVKVKILGEEYVVKGKASVGHIHQFGSHVDGLMLEIKQNNPRLSTVQVAILAAVNLAAELYRLQEDYDELLQILEEPNQTPASGSD